LKKTVSRGRETLRRRLAAGIFGLLGGLAWAQTAGGSGETTAASEILWDRGRIRLRLESLLPAGNAPPPVAKYNQQQANRRALPSYFRAALSELTIDSYTTFSEALNQRPELFAVLDELAASAELTANQLSLDQTRLIMDFEASLYPGLAAPFLTPRPYLPPAPPLPWEPSGTFTGLVIYAGNYLPVHGETDSRGLPRQERVRPCLFPKIFDQAMGLLLSPELMDWETLSREGAALYTRDPELGYLTGRVGDRPFYTSAVGLFGKYATDLILPQEDVRRFLARPENRELLRRGRIVVIY
jgi:hypothetical protein